MATPNINLAKFPLARELRKRFHVPVSLSNDVNLGLLGEKWFGAAKNAKNVVGLFPGTGLGGAIIIDGKLYTGTNGAAAEIGHMIVEPQGPLCSCGNRGCLEAVASRWAIERDIRQAVKSGERTIITHFTSGNLRLIKSKALKKALDAKDPLVTRIMKNASCALGKSCISLRHILNPDVIVLGGGVIEACGDFMLPIIKKVFSSDPFFKKIDRCRIVASQLKDDAVILGAIALARENSR